MRKRICFIGQTATTCQFIAAKISYYLREDVEVITWSLDNNSIPEGYELCEVYIFTSDKVLAKVNPLLPNNCPKIVATRTINVENIDKLFELEPQTQVLLVQTSKEMALSSLEIINSFGINDIEIIPYFPGKALADIKNVPIAITTGQSYLVPDFINQVIDLGSNDLNLSTYMEIIKILGLPSTLLDEISHNYIDKILNLTQKYQRIALFNKKLTQRIEGVLNTVSEAIVAYDDNGNVLLANNAAQKVLSEDAIDDNSANSILWLKEFTIEKCIKQGQNIVDELMLFTGRYYVVNASPIIGRGSESIGLVATIRAVDEVQALDSKVRRELKRKGHTAKYTFDSIIGKSSQICQQVKLAQKFACTNFTILIEGESGTGKELVAQAIHNFSLRQQGPFVALNFGAFPENLVESELFGFTEGAFTGAKKGGKLGLFEEAHAGTIFLDEIGDASLDVQKKILRVLEEKEVRRVGSSIVTPIDVRVVAATNQDLQALVARGLFRKDFILSFMCGAYIDSAITDTVRGYNVINKLLFRSIS